MGGSQQYSLKGRCDALNKVMEIGSPSDAWRALIIITAETNAEAAYRVKKDFEALIIGPNEKVRERRHNVSMYKREICRHALCGLSLQFLAAARSFARRQNFPLNNLEAEGTPVEDFPSEFERKAGGTPALAVTLMDGCKSRGGDGNSGATRRGKKKGKRRGGGECIRVRECEETVYVYFCSWELRLQKGVYFMIGKDLDQAT